MRTKASIIFVILATRIYGRPIEIVIQPTTARLGNVSIPRRFTSHVHLRHQRVQITILPAANQVLIVIIRIVQSVFNYEIHRRSYTQITFEELEVFQYEGVFGHGQLLVQTYFYVGHYGYGGAQPTEEDDHDKASNRFVHDKRHVDRLEEGE